MKKIFLTFFLFFGISQSFAADVVYTDPEIGDLPTTEVFATNIDTFDKIADNTNSLNRFCEAFGYTYSSHTSGTSGGQGRARYRLINLEWEWQSSNSSIATEIICDDGEIHGCTDSNAQNYDPNATLDNGTCTYDLSNAPTGHDINLLEDYVFAYFVGDTDAETYTPQMYCQAFANTQIVSSVVTAPFVVGQAYYYDINIGNFVDSLSFSNANPGRVFLEINCGSNSGGGGYTGDVTTREYLQLLVLKDGQYFLNQDIFLYLLIVSLVGILLMKTLIKIVSLSFAGGFYISSGSKILGKK